MPSELMLLIDGSMNPQSKTGYGAYLMVTDPDLPLAELRLQVKLRRFTQTSSSRLELQTLIWALGEMPASGCRVRVHTDSQTIIGLAGRRERLEQNGYRSSNNRPLNNALLYQEFYRLTDQLDCEFVQLRGHLTAKLKTPVDRLFTLVDRASRQALREESERESGRVGDDN
ncbi:ribonuclease HI [Geopsychrobacter electrodiphilus]|uniref:ribonuclease HI n=1 Tax=Geopsychrobacter electrodiphilus TaxID=225196 RepID=UPI000372E57F|nr:RNase H family protein [Geopsychrobacter electrodiphilus]